MTRWAYVRGREPKTITEEEILQLYYKWWSKKKFKEGQAVSPALCIEEWTKVNKAWKV